MGPPCCQARALPWLFIFFVVCLAPLLWSQTRRSGSAGESRSADSTVLQIHRQAIRETGQRAVTLIGICGDSLAVVISGSSGSAKRAFDLHSDSIEVRAAYVLNSVRGAALKTLRNSLSLLLARSSEERLLALRTRAQRSRQVILVSANEAAACAGCGTASDYDTMRDHFVGWCDSVKDASIEELYAWADDVLDSIALERENGQDSVSSAAERLLDEETAEREARADSIAREEEKASRLTVALAYDNPVTDRGRDNGVRYLAVSPLVRYDHRSGLFGEVTSSWLDKAGKKWDALATSIGFARPIGDDWFGSLSYTRFWFSETSPQAKSVLNNSLDLDMGWSVTSFAASVHLVYAFSKASETSIYLFVSSPLTVLETTRFGSLIFEPGLSGVYGQQDAGLVTARRQKSKKEPGTAPSGKATKVFAVMDYELTLPLSYRWGAYSLGASYTIVAPLNVVDESTSTVFGVAGLEFSLTIR